MPLPGEASGEGRCQPLARRPGCACLFKSPSLIRRGGGGSGLRKALPSEVSGTFVSWCHCLFKEAGLCPEEAGKCRPPDLQLPATRRARILRGALEARAFPARLEPRARGEAVVCGLARDEGACSSPTAFLASGAAQGVPGCGVAVSPAPPNCLAVH